MSDETDLAALRRISRLSDDVSRQRERAEKAESRARELEVAAERLLRCMPTPISGEAARAAGALERVMREGASPSSVGDAEPGRRLAFVARRGTSPEEESGGGERPNTATCGQRTAALSEGATYWCMKQKGHEGTEHEAMREDGTVYFWRGGGALRCDSDPARGARSGLEARVAELTAALLVARGYVHGSVNVIDAIDRVLAAPFVSESEPEQEKHARGEGLLPPVPSTSSSPPGVVGRVPGGVVPSTPLLHQPGDTSADAAPAADLSRTSEAWQSAVHNLEGHHDTGGEGAEQPKLIVQRPNEANEVTLDSPPFRPAELDDFAARGLCCRRCCQVREARRQRARARLEEEDAMTTAVDYGRCECECGECAFGRHCHQGGFCQVGYDGPCTCGQMRVAVPDDAEGGAASASAPFGVARDAYAGTRPLESRSFAAQEDWRSGRSAQVPRCWAVALVARGRRARHEAGHRQMKEHLCRCICSCCHDERLVHPTCKYNCGWPLSRRASDRADGADMLAGMEIVKPMSDKSDDVLDLCCGGKKCPVLRDDGDAIVIADADQVEGEIRLAKTDLPRVLAWLSKRSAG